VAETPIESGSSGAFALIPGDQVLDQIHDAVVSTDLEGLVTSWNRGAERMFGHSAEAMIGQHISVIYPPSEHEFLQQGVIAPLLEQGEHHVQIRALRASGELFHGHLSLSMLKVDGEPVGMIGFTMDITERVRGEQRQKLLVRELDHRVKNSLTVIRSLLHETAKRAESLDDFLAGFSGRLDAMVNAHELLAENRWVGVCLRRAIDSILYCPSPAIRLAGPDLELPPAIANPLWLVLHELATNARKHGALASDEGSLSLRWEVETEGLTMTWREEGLPERPQTRTQGLGLQLVRGLVELEIGGEIDLRFEPEGLCARLRIPLAAEGDRG
jgi:PAS domain S-box-containing protein